MSLLHAKSRTQGPTSQLKKLRRDGFVPIALIDSKRQPILLAANAREARAALATASGVGRMRLQVEGEKGERQVIVKQIDQDLMTHTLLAVTLSEVTADEIIRADVEVFAIGVPVAVAEGTATLTQPTSHIKVKGRVDKIPGKVEIDVSSLEFGHHITAADVELPESVELQSSPDATLFSVQPLRAVSLEPEIPDVAAMEGTGEEAAAETTEE